MNENARRADFARYGIAWSDRRGYEDDHGLIDVRRV
jgi:hypothetical protein